MSVSHRRAEATWTLDARSPGDVRAGARDHMTHMNDTILTPDRRTIGYDDYGPDDGVPVLWCHGGPGSRFEPMWLQDDAAAAGLRLVGIDRPGYGNSTPRPGRSIADGVADVLAVADHLAIDAFVTVGVSTGGAYARDRRCSLRAACSVSSPAVR